MKTKTRWIVIGILFAIALTLQAVFAGILPSGFGKTFEAAECIGCHPGRMATPAPKMPGPAPMMQIQRKPAPQPMASPAVRPAMQIQRKPDYAKHGDGK